METWFILALAAAVTGGFGAFTHKVAAVRRYDIPVLNIYASAISASLLGLGTWYFASFEYFWELSSLIAFLAAFTYFFTLVFKIGALQNIDAAVFFPLYKVSGPFITLLLGITIFSESFTALQWVGLGLSMCIPLLLITKAENKRQQNLKRGLLLLLGASLIGSISIAFTKFGASNASSPWLFLFVGDAFLAFSSILVLTQRYKSNTLRYIYKNTPRHAIAFIFIMGVVQALSAMTMVFAFTTGGTLAIVYTISSLYILIPIILSVVWYKEHFNIQKALAMILAVAALALLK